MAKIKNKVQLPESKLLKAMAELESAIEKGDELEDQDPEGGLSTEGTPLSNAAPSGKSSTKKSRSAKSSSSSDDASSVEKGDDDDDAESIEKMMSASDAESDEPPKKKSKKKSKKFEKASAASSDDDSSSADDDSSDRPAEKSFRPEEDETMSKAIEMSDFLEAFVDNIGVAFGRLAKSFSKELAAAESRLNARIDNRVAKSISFQNDFNGRMAKAVAAIGTTVQGEVVDMIKSLANSPAPAPRGKAVLSKGEVNQPPWGGSQAGDNRMAAGSDGDFLAELGELSQDAIGDWLFKKSATNQVDPKIILAWEADRYDPATLPMMVRKSIVNDLCK